MVFLERRRTENSLQQLEKLKTTHQGHDILIHAAFTKLRFKLEQHDWKAKQSSCDDDLLLYDDNTNFKSTPTSQNLSSKHSSDKLSSKFGSGLSSRSSLSEKRKIADIAKAKLNILKQKCRSRKEQSLLALERAESKKRTYDLEADLKLLNIKKEVAVAEAEVRSAEGKEICDRNIGDIEIESQTERTKKYVEQHSSASLYSDRRKPAVNYEGPSSVIRQSISQRPVPDASSIETLQLTGIPADFTEHMLKKDLLVSRLIKFNNKPEFYPSWRHSLKSVMLELDAKPEEEIDFLIKCTSNSSQQQIISIKSTNSHKPQKRTTKNLAETRREIWKSRVN